MPRSFCHFSSGPGYAPECEIRFHCRDKGQSWELGDGLRIVPLGRSFLQLEPSIFLHSNSQGFSDSPSEPVTCNRRRKRSSVSYWLDGCRADPGWRCQIPRASVSYVEERFQSLPATPCPSPEASISKPSCRCRLGNLWLIVAPPPVSRGALRAGFSRWLPRCHPSSIPTAV